MAVNDAIQSRGVQKQIAGSVAGVLSATLASAAAPLLLAAGYTAADTLGKPDAEFAAKLTFGANPSVEGTTVDLYVRAKNIQGANHAEIPTAAYKPRFVCSFLVKTGQATTWAMGVGEAMPKEGDFYFYNNGTGQTLQTSCELWMTPITLGPAAA